MPTDPPSTTEVEAVLRKANGSAVKPTDADLFPVYTFLSRNFPSHRAESSASTSTVPSSHFFCSKAQSELHRDAAVYLVFLFAFKRDGMPKTFIGALEDVLLGCEHCARAFGTARRQFAQRHLSGFPATTKTNFFAAVDRWQSELVLREFRSAQSELGPSDMSDRINIFELRTSVVQLLSNEPQLLKIPDIERITDCSMRMSTRPVYQATSLGLTAVIAHLLSSEEAFRRDWALAQLVSCAQRPIVLDDWYGSGIGAEIHRLWSQDLEHAAEWRWSALDRLLHSRCLSLEVVQIGLLEGKSASAMDRKTVARSMMAAVNQVLGSDTPYFSVVLSIFAELLAISPTRHIWLHDMSPDLPPTLFSEIKTNPSFMRLLEAGYPPLDTPEISGTGKGKEKTAGGEPLAWLEKMLVSLTDVTTARSPSADLVGVKSGFGETMARIMVFLFSELQHGSHSPQLSAIAAQTGCDILRAMRLCTSGHRAGESASVHSALEIHAAFIAALALRPEKRQSPAWNDPRSAARGVLSDYFESDQQDLHECMLFLANITFNERKRQYRRKKLKQEVKAAVPVMHLHLASVRKELWSHAYNALLPSDPEGMALIAKAMSYTAHMDTLDRHGAWEYRDLSEVIEENDWICGIRAVNNGLHATRDPFRHAVESLAMQADPGLAQNFWRVPGMVKAGIVLLLSPTDSIHDPVITLLQQAYGDVDDRADCFRILLRDHAAFAIDGLCSFLSTFIATANKAPESCSLAKWLVRCFTEILEVLCHTSDEAEALLQTPRFIDDYTDNRPMSKRMRDLWFLMTESLSVIFNRTQAWAPYYENAVMIDWMRDALIFGRHMTENVRAFEAAALGRTDSDPAGEDRGKSPAKLSSVGRKMVQQLEKVLKDLVAWLRLTDIETLHQTFELIKTILERLSHYAANAAEDPDLEKTLQDLDKFCRRASTSYRSKLSDDLLSELSDMLSAFNIGPSTDEVQFIKQVGGNERPISINSGAGHSAIVESRPASSASSSRNAFEEMMRKAGASKGKSGQSSQVTSASATANKQPKSYDMEADDDDDFLSSISPADLEIIERRAKASAGKPNIPAPRPSVPLQKHTPAVQKLNIDVRPRGSQPRAPAANKFKSSLMRGLHAEHRMDVVRNQRRDENIRAHVGGLATKASAIGTGLGAYTGQRKPVTPTMVDSGSSASESSDGDEHGVNALLRKQKKSPLKIQPVERRPIQVLGTPLADITRANEEKRARLHAQKMRLRPDLSPLYRYVLSWDPDFAGPSAPHPSSVKAQLGATIRLPTTFSDADKYGRFMLPLFLEELWEQLQKEQSAAPVIWVEINNRHYEDDFIEMELLVVDELRRENWLYDTDIVTLRQPGVAGGLFAKVQGFRKRPKGFDLKLRIVQSMDRPTLSNKSKWQLRKHAALGTAQREFGALAGFPYYERQLLQDVLSARAATMPKHSTSQIEHAMKSYDVNEPQAKAILGALEVKGFALIQGPPGTGKTKTISGLVGKFLSERAIPIAINGEVPNKPKLLLCAPSNAAIDEVCKRLMNGVPSSDGRTLMPKIVRIGVESSVNQAVRDVSLDNLIEARVSADPAAKDGGGEFGRIRAELESVKAQLVEKQQEIRGSQGNEEKRRELEAEHQRLMTRRTELGRQSTRAKDAAQAATRNLDGTRRQAKETILREADIICATLSGSGQDVLAPYTFETVIIDEAAQSIELSSLIPLRYGCTRCILVGDPNQLPPTTFSSDAERCGYNESLFVRMTRQNKANVQLLSIQYRMHPFISELPSKVFYDGQLKDGPGMAIKTRAIWHERQIYGPYRFFNVNGTEIKAGTSTKNPDEAVAAVQLYRNLRDTFSGRVNFDMRIGIITMYREQLYELRRKFQEAFGPSVFDTIEFNTVDGFQGQEKDIIILSCVRSGLNLTSIGFLKDPRRMNVALTRAKSSLFVIGNGPTLERSDEGWKTIVADAKERGFYIDYSPAIFTAKETVAKKDKARPQPPSPRRKSSSTSASPVQADFAIVPKAYASNKAPKRRPSGELGSPVDKKPKSESASSNPTSINGSVRPSTNADMARPIKPPRAPQNDVSTLPPPLSTVNRGPSLHAGDLPARTRPVAPALPPKKDEDILFVKKKKKR